MPAALHQSTKRQISGISPMPVLFFEYTLNSGTAVPARRFVPKRCQ
jgi:hypothetical protein